MQIQIKQLIHEIRPDLEEHVGNLLEEIDSIDIANLIALLEQTFNIEIPIYTVMPENFQDTASIENFIKTLKENK